MKKNLIMLLMLLVSTVMNAQSKIWINGNVYAIENGKQVMVPFATINVYDYPASDQVKYFAVCGQEGNYMVNPYEYTKKHHVVVTAPGYKTKEFNLKEIPETWNGEPFSGNATVNIKMEKATDAATIAYQPTTYTMTELNKNGTAKNALDVLTLIPEIKKDEDTWVDKETDESVCLFLNGIFVTRNIYEQLPELPANMITHVESYKLPQGGNYGKAININISAMEPCKAPDFELMESDLMFE